MDPFLQNGEESITDDLDSIITKGFTTFNVDWRMSAMASMNRFTWIRTHISP